MKKIAVLICSLLAISNLALSQSNQLSVNCVHQKGDALCWAATLEMIFKYNDASSPNDQCVNAEIMQAVRASRIVVCRPCTPHLPSATKNDCNKAAGVEDFKAVLNNPYKYHYTDGQTPNWNTIVNDINSNHPFMGFIGYPKLTDKCSSDHVVAIIGYEQKKNGNKYYVTQDPNRTCGQATGNKKWLFSTDAALMTVCSYFNEMYPNSTPYAHKVSLGTKDSTFAPPNDELSWQGEINKTLNQKDVDYLIKSLDYSAVETIYYSTYNQASFSTLELTYLNGKPPYARTTLQKVKDTWFPVSIELTEDEPYKIVRPTLDDIILSKRPDKLTTNLKIESYKKVVLVLPTHVQKEFYYFNYDKQALFLPITDEEELPQTVLTLKDIKTRYNKLGRNFTETLTDKPFNFNSFNNFKSFKNGEK
jgi:Peptidase_C39 like family